MIFRVALALLTYHKDKLLHCDSFEEIMNYLKNQLPAIDKPTLDKIMKEVIKHQLTFLLYFLNDFFTIGLHYRLYKTACRI